MVGGISQALVSTVVGLPRYWYGLPPWPSGQYAFTRQFDAGKYLTSLFFPDAQSTVDQLNPAYFIELNALSILQEALAPQQSDPGAQTDPLNQLVSNLLWPSDWPQLAQPNAGAAPEPAGGNPIGQVLNIIA